MNTVFFLSVKIGVICDSVLVFYTGGWLVRAYAETQAAANVLYSPLVLRVQL